jgi:hypothetical protein
MDTERKYALDFPTKDEVSRTLYNIWSLEQRIQFDEYMANSEGFRNSMKKNNLFQGDYKSCYSKINKKQ